MRRKTIAAADGLKDQDVGTYPQTNVDMKISGGLRGALLGGLLTAGGALSGLGLASWIGAVKPTPVPAVETPSFKYRIRFGYKDGKPFHELRDEQGNMVKESE